MKGKPEDYKGYDEYLCKKFNMTIEEMYGEHHTFKDRNLGIVELIKNSDKEPCRIFEFACNYGFLALEIIKEFPDVKYVCTNFLSKVVKYVRKQGIRSYWFDANDIPNTFLCFDTFVCTSLEHLENDRLIVASLPIGSTLYFCATNVYDRTHYWTFKTDYDVYKRYQDFMNILDIKTLNFGDRKKVIGRGVKYDTKFIS